MPDGDVFDRRVKRGWRNAASCVLGGGKADNALPAVLRALGKEVKASGCPGLDQILKALSEAIRSPHLVSTRASANAALDHVCLQYGSQATEFAVRAARCILAIGLDSAMFAVRVMDEGELRVHLTKEILAHMADSWMCPAGILPELVENGNVSYQEVEARRQENKRLVTAAPETNRMAIQLLADPSGVLVRVPQFHREKLSPSEILVTPLTP